MQCSSTHLHAPRVWQGYQPITSGYKASVTSRSAQLTFPKVLVYWQTECEVEQVGSLCANYHCLDCTQVTGFTATSADCIRKVQLDHLSLNSQELQDAFIFQHAWGNWYSKMHIHDKHTISHQHMPVCTHTDQIHLACDTTRYCKCLGALPFDPRKQVTMKRCCVDDLFPAKQWYEVKRYDM